MNNNINTSKDIEIYHSVSDESIKFPYEDYSILGDTAEIDKILNTCGPINLDAADVRSTLSKVAPNYIVTGSGDGGESIVDAFKEALSKLPVRTENIGKILLNLWIAPDCKMASAASLSDCIATIDKSIDICWGIAIDDSLIGQQVKITLLAASKEPNIAWDTRTANNNKTPNQLPFQDLIKLFDEDDDVNCK